MNENLYKLQLQHEKTFNLSKYRIYLIIRKDI